MWVTPGDMRVDFGNVLSGPEVCVGKGINDSFTLWPGVNVRGLSGVGLNQTQLILLPDSSDWEKGDWSDQISEQKSV